MTFGAAAVVVIVVVIGVLVASGSPSAPTVPSAAPTVQQPTVASLPDLGGPRSGLVPEVTLPVGARPYVGKQPVPPGFEFWEVAGSRLDIVAQMRAELPISAPLNGMPWCGELNDAITSWAWGSAADTIGVSFIDGGVMITRLPQPKGCHP